MDRATLESYGRRLDATGLRMAAMRTDGSGNVRSLQEVDWHAALVRFMTATGWTIVDHGSELSPSPSHEPSQGPRDSERTETQETKVIPMRGPRRGDG